MQSTRPISAVVDLSNVCCSDALGGSGEHPRWSCFDVLLQAWAQSDLGIAGDLLAIADANLRYRLTDADRLRMKTALRSGMVREVPSPADLELLALAEQHSYLVLSMDGFVDYRHTNPWIQGNTESFIGWRSSSSGNVELFRRDMGVRTSYSISNAEQRGDLKARRLVSRNAALLEHEYRCSTPTCIQHQLSPTRLIVLPVGDDQGRATCPSCGSELERLGRRPASAELKIEDVEGSARLRIAVSEGAPVVLGRGVGGSVDLGRIVSPDQAVAVSRRHLEVSVTGSTVIVCDLGSTNGTTIRRWDPGSLSSSRSVPVHPKEAIELRARDELVLANAIRIELSGQRIPTAAVGEPAAQPWADVPPSVVLSHERRTTETDPG